MNFISGTCSSVLSGRLVLICVYLGLLYILKHVIIIEGCTGIRAQLMIGIRLKFSTLVGRLVIT